MGFFSKKPSRDDIIAQGQAQQVADAEASAGEKLEESFSTGNPKLDLELTKIKAQLESFGEIRKSNSERFTRVGEQIGELRGMILDTNKTISKIEVSATKAIDLVESVQPEKQMIEIRKMDGKVEGLRANIESNESMLKDMMEELKKMRQQMNFYKGIEQVAKLNEEVKAEILEIKKVEATIERHSDKSETIYLDMEKKFAAYEKFESKIKDMDDTFHAIQIDFDKLKLGVSSKADKKEFISLMAKFEEFEKHTSEVLRLLDERNKQSKLEIKEVIRKMKKVVAKKHGLTLEEIEAAGMREKILPEISLNAQTIESSPSQSAAAFERAAAEAVQAAPTPAVAVQETIKQLSAPLQDTAIPASHAKDMAPKEAYSTQSQDENLKAPAASTLIPATVSITKTPGSSVGVQSTEKIQISPAPNDAALNFKDSQTEQLKSHYFEDLHEKKSHRELQNLHTNPTWQSEYASKHSNRHPSEHTTQEKNERGSLRHASTPPAFRAGGIFSLFGSEKKKKTKPSHRL